MSSKNTLLAAAESTAEDPKKQLIGELDLMRQNSELFIRQFAVLPWTERREGGQGVVQFMRSTRTEEAVAVKFFLSRAAYDSELDLYKVEVLRNMMPAVRMDISNANGEEQSCRGYPWPPCIVLEKGESLLDWKAKTQPAFSTIVDPVIRAARGGTCTGARDRTIAAEETADMWALGLIAFELLTSEMVFPPLLCTRETIWAKLCGREVLPWEDGAPEQKQKLAQLRGLKRAILQRSLSSDFRAAAIDAAMEMLPRHLRPLVIRAADAAVDASRSVTLSRTTLEVTDPILCGLPSHGRERELARDAFTPLRILTSLVDFSLTAADGEWFSVRLNSLVGVLRSVLPLLLQLTRLSPRKIPPGALSALSTLCALRKLGLSCCYMGGDCGLRSPVRNLAVVLRMLGAITHLDLAHTRVASAGWAILREGICSSGMRLHVRGLARCILDGGIRLFPESTAAPPDAASTTPAQRRQAGSHCGAPEHGLRPAASDAALSGLLCLDLELNLLTVSAMCAVLGQLSCLTCMHMPRTFFREGEASRGTLCTLCTQLAAALSHSGTLRLWELIWQLDLAPGETAGMHSVLGQWSQLRTLSLHRLWDESGSALAEVLAHLPQLHSLDLTPVSAADVAPLSAAVALCSGLTRLSLSLDSRVSYDDVSNRVETMLAQMTALQRLPASRLLLLTCMTFLSLSKVELPATAVPSLTRELAGMHALDTLALVGCAIGGCEITGLLRVIARRPVLRVLSMWTAAEPKGFVDQWAQQLPGMVALQEVHLKAVHRLGGMLNSHTGPALRCPRW
eukprot:jgi/Ulvmu1/2091/UM124_0006.1